MYPAPSPTLPRHQFGGVFFVDPKIHPQHRSMIAVFVVIAGFSLFACVFLYFLWRERQRETPTAAQHLPLPTDETMSSEGSSDESEYQTQISMPPHEVELMPVGPPIFSCPVCLGPPVREMSTKCGHIFCKACIKAAIRAQGKCPTCREVLTRRELIRVYLPSTS